MGGMKTGFALKPGQHVVAVQVGFLERKQGVIGGIGPLAKVVDEAMFLRVLMDVDDQAAKVSVGGDFHPAKGSLE